ncbi:hypothetical protein BUALT_Bualt04G0112800 [Buddleja alternifolia]|uniref:Pentatricopeptide repeat-containing protein n=1 Tax=Buddleja alternifolia TaxID=168488 RepID=A0AAV6XUH9_9LAMI|nr:hypothetical protein BUALT_Bualt04G0112800 [Buddleja alternifolia]
MARLLSRASSLHNTFSPDFLFHLATFNRSLHTTPHFTKYFHSLLPLCRKSQDLKALNSLLIVHGLIRSQPLIRKFINQCCHLGFPDLALSAFEKIEKQSLYLQNLVLRSLSDNGLFENVILVYRKCRESGFLSDNYTYPFVIKACATLGDFCFGTMMHSVVLRTGFGGNIVVQTALLDFYSKIGEMENARKVVDEIPEPDIVAWNALISGYSINGFDREVIRVFHDMCVMDVKPNASTLASVFPVCSRAGFMDVGILLCGLAYKLGYSEDESLVPALISMYANFGDLLAARNIFDTSGRENVAIWNAMISAYTRNRKPENAAALFKAMLLDDVKPNMVTFVSLIPSSENLVNIWYVESIHAYVIKFGFKKELSIITALLSVYAKLGNMDSAESLCINLPKRNLLFWNSIVSAYAGHGLPEQSLEAVRAMQMDGFDPDAISIISLLSSCSELEGKSVHAFSLKNGIDLNPNASNAFLAFYCDFGVLAYSFRVFNRMVQKSTVSWNTMISGCLDNGESERGMLLFHEMKQKGVNFDLVTLISILPSCRNSVLGLAIHGYAIKTAFITDTSLANALVSMYINSGELEAAKLLFDDMPDRSVVSWNAILTGFRHHDSEKETLELFNQMIAEDRKPNYITLLNVLPACNTLLQGKSLHAYIYRKLIPLETPLLTSLMIMYARFENLRLCSIMFHMGDERSISLWNTIISAYLLSNNTTMAVSFFRELLWIKIEPDYVTILNIISVCAHFKNLQVSNSALAYIVKKGFKKDVAISNALIDLYAKCGSLSSARTLFEMMPIKDTISWNVMINGYGLHGDGVSALALYSQMRLFGLKPDRVTYMSILSACSHAGFVEHGRMVFDCMISDGVLPGMEHYACIVDLLGRTGHLNEAHQIIKNLPQKDCVNLLESLLGACLSHGDFGLGEEIGRMLLESNPKDSSPYVILYNVYAAAGKWIDANNVRLAMEQKEFNKIAGISLVDGNISIHNHDV